MPIPISVDLRNAYLRSIISAQAADEEEIERNREFYDGEQGIKLTSRQREYLGDIANDLTKQAFANICRRCVGIPLERLRIDKVLPNNEESEEYSDVVNGWWEKSGLDAIQSQLYENSLRDKASVIIVGYDQKNLQPEFTVNDLYDGKTGQIRLHYNEDTDELMFASKRWKSWDNDSQTATGKTMLTIFFDDRIERYEESGKMPPWRLLDPLEIDPTGETTNPQWWTDTGFQDGEPLGNPVIPFRNPGGSELDDILMPQKAMNKGIADLISSSDFSGFPIITLSGGVVTDENKPETGPGRILYNMSPDAKWGRIEAANLKDVLEVAVFGWIQIASVIKGWPPYLFLRGTPPSGEALKSMEASLIAQVERKQSVFGDAWRKVFRLSEKLDRRFNKGADFTDSRLKFEWHPASPRDKKQDAETLEIKWRSGEIPVEQRWIELGYSPDKIKEMQGMKEAEQAQALTAMMDAAREREIISPNDDGIGEEGE